MRIVQTRRISQIFFFCLFSWFCLVATLGSQFYQIQGWPVNWFFQLDPLVALGTVLTTHTTLYRGLLWALATVLLTILFGRFFCGWVCPFGALHQLSGFVGHRYTRGLRKIRLNGPHSLHGLKYVLLLIFLGAALLPTADRLLLIGLLDPITLVTRSFNLFALPVIDTFFQFTAVKERLYQGSLLIMLVFWSALLANLIRPRFYCRFICPLGALLGLISRLAVWRIGKQQQQCSDCKQCEQVCEGGCSPSTSIHTSECLLCCNCLDSCPDQIITYQARVDPAGADSRPDISRRGFTLSLISGFLTVPALKLENRGHTNGNSILIRPPGSLDEREFLQQCIKCSQCMRICPTNVLQPAGFEHGLESLWSPILNNRIGSSGCQLNCTACSQICPTAAIRPLSLNEKLGKQEFADQGPVKIGTAFIQRGRCLPWAMDKPCIVCEENCPLSPKAIHTRPVFVALRDSPLQVEQIAAARISISGRKLVPGRYGSGDYFCLLNGEQYRITANGRDYLQLDRTPAVREQAPTQITVQIRLQRPYVDIERCIGCGICEHECPVNGRTAIRVSAEGETRNPTRALLLRRSYFQEKKYE